MFNEPPKYFNFTPFHIDSIKSDIAPRFRLNEDLNVTISDDLGSEEHPPEAKVNVCGYMVDKEGNIIDKEQGQVVLRKEVLLAVKDHKDRMVKAQIPIVFQ
jgi:hypothetical protein